MFLGAIGFCRGRSLGGETFVVFASWRLLASGVSTATLPIYAPRGTYAVDTKPNNYFHLKMRNSVAQHFETKWLGWVSRCAEAVGRGTGKLQRKLETNRLPPSRTRQCTGENPTRKWHINTRHWKINLELCSEPHNVSVQRSLQQGGFFKNTLEFGVTQQVMWKCTLFNLPEAAKPAGFGFSAPRK